MLLVVAGAVDVPDALFAPLPLVLPLALALLALVLELDAPDAPVVEL